MSTKIKYTDEPLGELKIVPDFLPSPAELAFREESVKVTISLSKKSIEFFKDEASKHHTQYQRMIRQLLDTYADMQSAQRTKRSTRTAKKQAAGKTGTQGNRAVGGRTWQRIMTNIHIGSHGRRMTPNTWDFAPSFQA